MQVPFDVKVPIERAMELRAMLDKVTKIHEGEVAALAKRAKVAPEAAAAEIDQTAQRGRKLTSSSMIRIAVLRGLEEISKMDPKDVLVLIGNDGVALGRPRRGR